MMSSVGRYGNVSEEKSGCDFDVVSHKNAHQTEESERECDDVVGRYGNVSQ